MSTQHDLFTHPMARRTDHDSSHAAADALERTGQAKAQRDEALALVHRWPGMTANQLAELADTSHYHAGCPNCYRNLLSRRLSELRREGKVEAVKPEGREIQWWPSH